MAIKYVLVSFPIWYFPNQNGLAAGGCIIYPRSANDHDIWLPMYSDPEGLEQWPFDENGGIVFQGNGAQGPFYVALDDTAPIYYYITVYNAQGDLLWTFDEFPLGAGSGGSSPVDVVSNINNLIIDGQFRFLNFTNPLTPIGIGEIPIDLMNVGPNGNNGWIFSKDVTGNTDTLSYSRTSLSSTSPPSNPFNILSYQCTAASGSGTRLDLGYRTFDVKTFSSQTISIQFYANSIGGPPSVTGEFYFRQVYGTGGSPSATTEQTVPFTFPVGGFNPISATISINSVAGKSLGSNNDDYFEMGIRFPIGSTGTYQVSDAMAVFGSALPTSYLYETYNDTYYKIAAIAGSRVGDRIFSDNNTPRQGWITVSDNQSIGGPSSTATYKTSYLGYSLFNLYSVWWKSSDGFSGQPVVVGGRGVSASSDWNAGKNIIVPFMSGRVFGVWNGSAFPHLDSITGAPTVTLDIPHIPAHTHNVTIGTDQTAFLNVNLGSSFGVHPVGPTTLTTTSVGGGLAHENMQPTSFLICFVKL